MVPGVIDDAVLFSALTLIVLEVTYLTMVISTPVELGPNPVTPVGSLAKSICTVSVAAAPVHVIVCGVDDEAP
jgi:hypothetical protein